MKKYLLYSLIALAGLALSSCDDEDFDDWSSAQAYDQEDSVAGYAVLGEGSSSIVMDNLGDDGLVQLYTVASADGIASYNVTSLTVDGESVDGAYVEDGYLVIDAAEIAKAVEKEYFSRAATTRSIEIAATLSITLDSGDAVLDEISSTVSFTDYTVPAASASGYYMLGSWQGWTLASPTVMEAQADGTYKATVTTTSSGDNWYKFYRADSWSDSDWEVVNAGQIGCAVADDASLSNIAVYDGDPVYDGVQTPVISGASTWEVTFDPANLTYTVTRAERMYYPVGTLDGWAGTAQAYILFPQGSNIYRISSYFTASYDFKFWQEGYYGIWGSADDPSSSVFGSILDENGTTAETGTIASAGYSDGVGCFASPAAGYYTFTADMANMTYSWTAVEDTPTEYTSIGITGDFNGWDQTDATYHLTQQVTASSTNSHCWYLQATLTAGGLKFVANDGWDINWGLGVDISENCYGTGVQGGDNITVPAGTYNIYINDITGDFVFVAVE